MSNDAQPAENPFAAQQSMLSERLRLLLGTLHPALLSDVVQALEGEGKLLSQPRIDINPLSLPAGIWPLLTLLVAQHVSSEIDPRCASSVAIAVECFICALDLLDDVEDDDQTPIVQALGVARGNLAVAQKTLAERLVELYTTQDTQSDLSVILGAQSLDDLVSRVETLNVVTNQSTSLVQQITSYEGSMGKYASGSNSAFFASGIGSLLLLNRASFAARSPAMRCA